MRLLNQAGQYTERKIKEVIMAGKEELKKGLSKWKAIAEDPEMAEHFVGYNKTMQLIFPDVNVGLQMVFKGSNVDIVEGIREDADMSLSLDSEMFMGIINGDIDPIDAFMEGKLKPTGSMEDLEKLQVLMDIEL
jgi:putative sterol carrier protein